MTWSLVALAILSLALLAITRARRADSHTGSEAPATPSRPDEPQRAAARSAGPDEDNPVRSCPVCLSEYPGRNRFCVRDGAALADGRPSGPFFQGMICPTCRRGYPSDASYCPEDSDDLVPYGLYGATSSTAPFTLDGNKICPECGIRHAAAHLFCGQDGTELVIVN